MAGVPTGDSVNQFPTTITHVKNGELANQNVFNVPTRALEKRTDVLKDFVNSLESTLATISSKVTNHDHSLPNETLGKHLTFQKLYEYSGTAGDSLVTLTNNGYLKLKLGSDAASKFVVVNNSDDTEYLKVTNSGVTLSTINAGDVKLLAGSSFSIKKSDNSELLKADNDSGYVTIPKVKSSTIDLDAGASFTIKKSDNLEIFKADNNSNSVTIPVMNASTVQLAATKSFTIKKSDSSELLKVDNDSSSVSIPAMGPTTVQLEASKSFSVKKSGGTPDLLKIDNDSGDIEMQSSAHLKLAATKSFKVTDASNADILKVDNDSKSVSVASTTVNLAPTKSFVVKKHDASELLKVDNDTGQITLGSTSTFTINLSMGSQFIVKASDGTALLTIDNNNKKVIIPPAYQQFT